MPPSSRSELFFLILLLFCTMQASSSSSTVMAMTNNKTDGICDTFVVKRGFRCREFTVRTRDQYLLSLQRISNKHDSWSEKKPVFLYHGIMQGGDIWVLNNRNESLGFVLADSGYDVWIGNTRSSQFSVGHLLYSRSQQEYWNWNLDDLVAYDLPSMLRFIRRTTKKRIFFVGFSQGTMIGFAAFTHKKLHNLVEKAVMLSPIVYLSNIKSLVARMAASFFLDQLDLILGVARFSLSDERVQRILGIACFESKSDCYRDLLALIEGPSCCINRTRMAYYNRYGLQPTSMRNIAQLAQFLRSGRFCKYDYGIFGNIFHYWKIHPPPYKLGKLPKSLPFLLAHGGKDYLADGVDLRRLQREIPGSVELLFMPNYSHEDFILGTSARFDVYPRVLNFFREDD